MRSKLILIYLTTSLACCLPGAVRANPDGFNDVVKTIESFYHVKHQSLPFLARAGMKAMRTAAKVRGGDWKRLAEAGSIRVVFFEDQNFDSRGQIASFKASVRNALGPEWSALAQALSPKDEEQSHIFIRETGTKFQVMVITIERHDATVVQATVAPNVLAELMKDPGEMGKSLTDEATMKDP
jgi:hypothetical protein